MERHALEIAISELDTVELSSHLYNLFNSMDEGWQKEALRNWKMLTIKHRDLIRVLSEQNQTIQDTKFSETEFYPMSTPAKSKRQC